IVEDLRQQEREVSAALRRAGRGSELVGQARWWAEPQAHGQQAAAEAAAEKRQAAAAAAAATREVDAAAHATAVQAASRAETAAAAEGGGGGAGRHAGSEAQQQQQQQQQPGVPPPSTSTSPADSSWQWQAVGRWAERVSGELRAAIGQVERLEKDRHHEAAVAALHEVLETYTDVTRFPRPQRPDAVVIVGAQHDAYVSPQSVLELQQHLTGSEVRWVPGGHVTSFLLHHGSFRRAIADSLAKLAQPPPLVVPQAGHLMSSSS
ncbi:hypothetical protein CHLNCDRAFT_141612, partial [Chlorella variabilis]